MIFFLFTRFILNPRLLLTELRSEYGGSLSFIAAALSVMTATLASALVFGQRGGIPVWLLSSFTGLIVLLGLAVFYLPVIHLFAEKNLPGSRVTDLLVYAGFILAPLLLALPLAFIALLIPYGTFFYLAGFAVIIVKIFLGFVAGVRSNYRLRTGQAVLISFAPLLYLLLFPAVITFLTLLSALYA